MTRTRPQAANRKGLIAEMATLVLMMAKDYRLLARRYSSLVGKINLIARRGRRIAFIEVKARASYEEDGVGSDAASAAANSACRRTLARTVWRGSRLRHRIRRGLDLTMARAQAYCGHISSLTLRPLGGSLRPARAQTSAGASIK